MSNDELRNRIAELEAEVVRRHGGPPPGMTFGEWWSLRKPKPMTAEELETHEQATAYGRYFRVTGKEPPEDWKPGDPIPEPDYDE